MDIEAWWVTVHRVKESNMTKETENPTAYFKPTFSFFFFFFLNLDVLGLLAEKATETSERRNVSEHNSLLQKLSDHELCKQTS